MSLENKILNMVQEAEKASRELAVVSTRQKDETLRKMAFALMSQKKYILSENKKDILAAQNQGYSKALVDRLTLNEKRLKEMADCLQATAKLKDPVGEVIRIFKRPNGLIIRKVRTPIGVIGIIYESRPNVTSDCIGLCLKSGNAVILKGGK